MVEQPDAGTIIEIFDNITSTMLSLETVQDPSVGSGDDQAALLYCTAASSVPGPDSITVAVSSNLHGARALASALFAVGLPDVDASMLTDTMAELANMLAGQLKGVLSLQQDLGLPKVLGEGAFLWSLDSDAWRHIPVKTGNVQVLLSISTDAESVGLFL